MAGRAALRGLEAHAKYTCITPDGHVFCYTCSKHWKEVALDGRSTGSKWLNGDQEGRGRGEEGPGLGEGDVLARRLRAQDLGAGRRVAAHEPDRVLGANASVISVHLAFRISH